MLDTTRTKEWEERITALEEATNRLMCMAVVEWQRTRTPVYTESIDTITEVIDALWEFYDNEGFGPLTDE